MSTMRIGIDCRLAGLSNAGIGRYISNLISRLPKLSPQTEWIYFFHDQTQIDQILPHIPANVTTVIVPVRHYTLAEQLKLPKIFSRYDLDLLHVPHFNVPLLYRGKMVVTIHDLLWHQQRGDQVTTLSGWKYWLKYFAYRLVVTQAVAKAVAILVPAQTIKKVLNQTYPGSKSKTIITQEGVDQALVSTQKPNLNPEKILLYVGSLYPHKNVKRIIEALPDLPEYKLWLIGSRSVFQDKIKTSIDLKNVADRVKFLGFLSDQELKSHYHSCFALIQPSLSEGFGLTGLEAMAAGAAVIASDIPIFKEVYQDAAIFFDPNSNQSFIEAVHQLETINRSRLHQKSLKVVKQYSWDQMAAQTLAAYKNSQNS